jgi:2',3'-cyclic-nucleotide 2'-phosphodiesterase (5'-nucleotidase family)
VARWATFISRNSDPDAAWLVVDAGNYVDRQGTGGCSNKCQFLVTSYKDLHYDVLNLGRQETWMGYETLTAMLDTIKGTQFVSANLLDLKTRRPLAKPYVIKDYGTLRVGIIGLLNEGDFPKGTSLLDTTRLMIQPYLEAAKKYIPALSRKVDAVVLLCELPSAQIDTLLKVVPDIDVVISTGALRTGEGATTVGHTHILGTGQSGYNGHYAMLEFNPAWKDSIDFRQYQDALSDTYEEKGVWADRLAAFNAAPPPSPKPTPTPAASAAPKPLEVKPVPAPSTQSKQG